MHPIRRRRLERGWTQTDLAQRIDVTINSVVAWEKGAMPRPKMLPRIAAALGTTTAELLAEIEHWRATEGKATAA